jgi:hypothetical protein
LTEWGEKEKHLLAVMGFKGPEKVWKQLNWEVVRVARFTVFRLMKEMGP